MSESESDIHSFCQTTVVTVFKMTPEKNQQQHVFHDTGCNKKTLHIKVCGFRVQNYIWKDMMSVAVEFLSFFNTVSTKSG